MLTLTVDYARAIHDVLDEAELGWRAPARLGVFGSGRHELTAERIAFPEDVATPRVLARMAEQALRPATLFELASAAAADRALGRSTMVIALGSCDVNFVGGSASPAIVTVDGERQLTMTGFLEAWPAGTEFLAIPKGLAAGLGSVAHNHLLPIEARRSPKLVFAQPPTSSVHEVPYDSSLAFRAVAKKAKLRNISELLDEEPAVPQGPPRATTLHMTVLQLNRQLRTRDVAAVFEQRGMRPATIHELVALVAAEPTLIDNRSIWAVGGTLPVGAYKAGARTLGVHVGIGPEDRWPFTHAFAGVAV